MIRRSNLFPRGSAAKRFRFSLNSTRTQNFSFSTSATQPQASRLPKAYLICAVGGLFVASSKRDDTEDMAPLNLPGRAGNLTDEQKVKLKEMWSTAFKVFGVPQDRTAPEPENANDSNSEVSRRGTDISETQQKKGNLMSLFKKKNDREASSPAPSATDITSDVSKLSIADGDDKYSQTKEFKEAIATSTPQDIHDTFWRMVKADHPDSLLLRFLRARKWDVNKAIVMLVATMRWRSKELDVCMIIRTLLIVGGRSCGEGGIAFC